MARGERLHCRVDVDFLANDPRLNGCIASHRWVYLSLWGAAVRFARELLPSYYGVSGIAKDSHLDPRTVRSALIELSSSQKSLIKIYEKEDKFYIRVIGVRGHHKRLKWKNFPIQGMKPVDLEKNPEKANLGEKVGRKWFKKDQLSTNSAPTQHKLNINLEKSAHKNAELKSGKRSEELVIIDDYTEVNTDPEKDPIFPVRGKKARTMGHIEVEVEDKRVLESNSLRVEEGNEEAPAVVGDTGASEEGRGEPTGSEERTHVSPPPGSIGQLTRELMPKITPNSTDSGEAHPSEAGPPSETSPQRSTKKPTAAARRKQRLIEEVLKAEEEDRVRSGKALF